MIMKEWQIVILFILIFVAMLYPTKDVRSEVGNDPDLLKYRTIVNLSLCFIYVAIYLLFFRDNNTIAIACFFGVIIIIYIFEVLVFMKINLRKLEERIKKIPNFMNLSKGQIRNELINIYDEVYDIKSIEKVLKRIGYYD